MLNGEIPLNCYQSNGIGCGIRLLLHKTQVATVKIVAMFSISVQVAPKPESDLWKSNLVEIRLILRCCDVANLICDLSAPDLRMSAYVCQSRPNFKVTPDRYGLGSRRERTTTHFLVQLIQPMNIWGKADKTKIRCQVN